MSAPTTTAPNPPPREKYVLAQTWLDPELATGVDLAVRDGRTTRADWLRRLIVESLRLSGHLDPNPTPRRHRVKRRPEAA